jgi:hypothetical protein
VAGGQGALRLGGGDQGGQALAEALHERLAAVPGRAGGRPLQLGEEHPHQAWMLLEQARMAGQQRLDQLQGGRSCPAW